jgi:hypothetical protein
MKTKIAVLVVAVLSFCMLMRSSVMAIDLSINVGDRPYYTEGPRYWDNGYEWVWIPGSWGEHHHWRHGHYERRGEFHREHANEHHQHRDHDH